MSIFKFYFHSIIKHSPWFQSRETLSHMRCVPVVETTGYVYDVMNNLLNQQNLREN